MSATASQTTIAQQPVRSSPTLDSLVPFASPKRQRRWSCQGDDKADVATEQWIEWEESDGALPDRI